MRERKIVLLIDAENTSARYAKRIVEYLEKRGDIICARIYGDFINNASVKGWNYVAIEYEMEQKQQLTTSAGKNSSDIALVIDAMDLIYQKSIDTLCIVTSDGDFTGLVKRIREDGIEVIGMGKADASKRLEKVCDLYLDFDQLEQEKKPVAKAKQTVKTTAEQKKRSGREKPVKEKASKETSEKEKPAKEKASKETSEKEKPAREKNVKEKTGKDSQGTSKRNQTNGKVAKNNREKQNAKGQMKGAQQKERQGKSQDTAVNTAVNTAGTMKVGTRKAVWGNETKAKVQPEREKIPGNDIATKLSCAVKTIEDLVEQEEKNGKHAELGGVKSQLQLKIPDFQEREFGYKTIRELINAETRYEVVLEGRHTYVMPASAKTTVSQQKESEKPKKSVGSYLKEFISKKNETK